jgi:hypothetical protein
MSLMPPLQAVHVISYSLTVQNLILFASDAKASLGTFMKLNGARCFTCLSPQQTWKFMEGEIRLANQRIRNSQESRESKDQLW